MEYRFIGREREMGYLEELYSRPGLKTCAVLGRRQIGKSTLLREFTKDKRTVFLQFSKNSYYENFCRLRQDLEDFLGREMEDTDSFSDLMIVLRDICREEPTVVVFDELPYLMEGAPFVPSIIQRFVDADVRGLDCMVVICGSSVSIMRDAIEKIGSPLYGRFTDRLEVGELDDHRPVKPGGQVRVGKGEALRLEGVVAPAEKQRCRRQHGEQEGQPPPGMSLFGMGVGCHALSSPLKKSYSVVVYHRCREIPIGHVHMGAVFPDRFFVLL